MTFRKRGQHWNNIYDLLKSKYLAKFVLFLKSKIKAQIIQRYVGYYIGIKEHEERSDQKNSTERHGLG